MAVSTLKTGTPPAWVDLVTSEAHTTTQSDPQTGGQSFALVDTQVNIARSETFAHVIKEITSDTGVQNGANLQFQWDPSYQELIVHQVTIYRGAERIDRLDLSKFKIIQQERGLNLQVYNGTLSALLFLEDIRVGDRIEYAYTLRGENPAIKEHYAETFLLGSALPVEHRRIRLLCPNTRTLKVKSFGTNLAPTLRVGDNLEQYIWDMTNAPEVTVEDQTPSWYPAYPWIQLSEFANWSDVVKWGCELFENTNLDAPQIAAEIASLRDPEATAPETVQHALDFVQNNIRYLGIEFGPNSYRPSDPNTVLQRRFGDCKDKAVLFCTLVRGLGYDAVPVLVGTGFRHTLPDLLPAPQDFDHVIVRVIADGRVYWLDPTRSYQHGPIGKRYLPDFGFGLLLQPGETDLTRIPTSFTGFPETSTSEVFHIGGQKESAQLSVTTTARGYDAEWMRAILTTAGRDALAKDYLNDYAHRYPGITPAAPLTIDDSKDSDVLSVTQTYTITNFWTLSRDQQHYRCEFYPLSIHAWIAKPATAIRSMPLELSFPRRRIVSTEIDLPRTFALTSITNTISGPGGRLLVQRISKGNRVLLSYAYTSNTNFIPVSLTGEYLSSLDEMEAALGYSLTWQNIELIKSRSQFNWLVFLIAAAYTGLLTAGASLLSVRQCRSAATALSGQPPLLPDRQLNGLGGWLVLPCIGLFLGSATMLFHIAKLSSAFALWKWHAITTPGGTSYDPLWAPMLTFELLSELTILTLNIIALILFFQKRRVFPKWFIAVLALNALFVFGDAIGAQFLKTHSADAAEKMARSITRVVGGCAIWIPYMCVSRRVKSTFVR